MSYYGMCMGHCYDIKLHSHLWWLCEELLKPVMDANHLPKADQSLLCCMHKLLSDLQYHVSQVTHMYPCRMVLTKDQAVSIATQPSWRTSVEHICVMHPLAASAVKAAAWDTGATAEGKESLERDKYSRTGTSACWFAPLRRSVAPGLLLLFFSMRLRSLRQVLGLYPREFPWTTPCATCPRPCARGSRGKSLPTYRCVPV